MTNPKVSVVIVNYNGKKYLNNCLLSLRDQTYRNFEVIFVDNASGDGSVEYVKDNFPFTCIIENPENYGFAKGNNIGIGASKGELIATLNNDTEVTPGWIEELVKAMRSQKDIGMCASKMLFMRKRGVINSTGICISRSGACWDRGMFEQDCGQYESAGEVFGPCAGAAMYRKSMLDEIGLFDEDFHAYMEDADLAFRGRLAGWKCLYAPGAVVYHYHGGTAGYASDYTIYYGNRNIVWNSIKNFPSRLLITSLPWIIGRNLVVIPYYFLNGHAKAILQSKLDAIKGIPKMLAKRSHCMVDENEIKIWMRTWAEIRSSPVADI